MERELIELRKDNDRLIENKNEVKELKAKVESLERAKKEMDEEENAPLSWEQDDELKEMSASDLLEILGEELSFRERAILNGRVVEELQAELEKKSDALLKKMIEVNHKQQEVDRLTVKVKCLEGKGSPFVLEEEKVEERRMTRSRSSMLPSELSAKKAETTSLPKPNLENLLPIPSHVKQQPEGNKKRLLSPLKMPASPSSTHVDKKVRVKSPQKAVTVAPAGPAKAIRSSKLANAAPANPFKAKKEQAAQSSKPLNTITNNDKRTLRK